MDLSDTNYKLMDLEIHFWSFVDLNDTSLQVGGPLVHFTLFKSTESEALTLD